MKIKTCVKCSGTKVKRSLLEHRRDVGNQPFAGSVPGAVCAECGTVYYELPGLKAFDLEAAVWLARNGASTGEAMKFMRRVVGLTAERLASLLSLTAESISRIETGKLPPEARTVAILGAMVVDRRNNRTETIERLEAIAKVERTREGRVADYREQLESLPPGPRREQVKIAMRDWLTMGSKRKADLAELYLEPLR